MLLLVACTPHTYKATVRELQPFHNSTMAEGTRTLLKPSGDIPGKNTVWYIDFLVNRTDSALLITDPVYADRIFREVRAFYTILQNQPVWYSENGPTHEAKLLLDVLLRADEHGLDPMDYNTFEILNLQLAVFGMETPDPMAMAFLDVQASISAVTFALHLKYGRAPQQTHYGVGQTNDSVGMASSLVDQKISKLLANAAEGRIWYEPTLKALTQYRELSNHWSPLPADLTLKHGDTSRYVAILADRLKLTGDLNSTKTTSEFMDEDLEAAVKHFQQRHGLEADGVIGKSTLAALNVPPSDRIRALRRNLERMRWMPEQPGELYLLINLPAYELYVVRGNRKILEMRVIVGKEDSQTPLFYDEIEHIVFNPTWKIPPSIVVNEMYPKIIADPDYLTRSGYELYLDWYTDEPTDPDSVDWEAIEPHLADLKIIQRAGPGNALGKAKFMLPNPFYVYLHDSPSNYLFSRSKRAFSHGCIRLENPESLAYCLLENQGWTKEGIRDAMQSNKPEEVYLDRPVPVYFVYYTAWSEEDGTVHFRDDVYGQDLDLSTPRLVQESIPSPAPD